MIFINRIQSTSKGILVRLGAKLFFIKRFTVSAKPAYFLLLQKLINRSFRNLRTHVRLFNIELIYFAKSDERLLHPSVHRYKFLLEVLGVIR